MEMTEGLIWCCSHGYTKAVFLISLGVAVGILSTNYITEQYRRLHESRMSQFQGENKTLSSLKDEKTGSAVKIDKHRYVCPTFGSRLGNLMFLYASNYGIAYDYNLTLVMENNDPIYQPFKNIPKSPRVRSDVCRGFKFRVIQQKPRYYQKFKIPKTGNVAVFGYLQTWKYFSNSFEDLKKQFQWKWNIQNKALRIIKKLCSKHYPTIAPMFVTTVGIHIRRGDYIREKRPMADKDYIETAKKYFLNNYKNVLFIVATNVENEAKIWCETNVINGTGISIFSGFNNQYVDMAILSLCKHIIISTGTYGWWAAFLNKGTVIHFDWIPDHHVKYNRDDYILPQWIGIKPSLPVKY